MKTSFKADEATIAKIIEYYKEFEQDVDNTNIYFRASNKDFSVTIYSTFTVFFQGKKATEELAKWIKIKEESNEDINDYIDHIGSDEVGTGDYFGPVIVCACKVNVKDYDYLLNLGIKDSKQLSDEKILILADKIKEKVDYSVFTLTNKKYNEIYSTNIYNLNKIKAYLHNFVLFNLVKKTSFSGKIVVDQFCEENTYYRYLMDYKNDDIQRNITFTTKAENKYLAVACASIIARCTFLNEIRKIKIETGYDIVLGASDKVNEIAKKIYSEKGYKYLAKYVKLHFKNTKIITESEE